MTTMYNLKPIINHDVIIERPTCMYEMKNIHDDGDSRQKCRIVSEAPLADVAALEARQEKILAQLAELKKQVLNMCTVLNKSPKSDQWKRQNPVSAEFVLNVSPLRPCYSLLALQKLWSDVDIRISPFVHSTVKSVIPEGFNRTQKSNKESVIDVSLIWKQVLDTELVVSGVQNLPMIGESNLLRYLVRMINNGTYEKAESITETLKMDKVLDLSHQLIHETSIEDKQATMNLLRDVLGKNDWFSGKNQLGIQDIAVWSSIKQNIVFVSFQTLSSNFSSWYQKCDELFL